MLTDLQVFIVALASVAGALLAAVLGWLESGEAFNARKFTASLLRAFIAGLVFAIGSFVSLESIDFWTIISALLGGAGVDVLGNRAAGAVASRNKPASP